MIHTFIGNLGHLSVIVSFISALLAAISYYLMAGQQNIDKQRQWRTNARFSFYLHTAAVFGIVISLFYIIYNHYYEYHYAWSHSSSTLPTHFMISSFWEGQEGSFLLWMFWQAILGVILIHTNKTWEAPMMVIFALVQAFLASMILGVVPFEGLKIGSSPFILLRDAMEAPIFQQNPNFVPEDGTGLNPLLQNYWMVIHPPVLFLGFAATLVPFAFMMGGLWQRKFSEWIRPALPWTIFGVGILGLGIMMGAYWAYETLNFGGYWNWDPVENAVYIPWLILVGSLHLMINYRKNKTGLKATYILVTAAFILILYSTFLTRSGVLGESSVHSFTDLGLSGQLLIYLFAFIVISTLVLISRWNEVEEKSTDFNFYNSDTWVFLGVIVITLMGFQVLIPTSYPVINAILGVFGIDSNLALPSEQEVFYSQFQIWFGIGLAILSGTAQYFWWRKQDKKSIKNTFTLPLIVTLLLSTIAIAISKLDNLTYILLFTTAIYAFVANGNILLDFLRSKSNKLSGGSIAHLGLAVMLIGILFSSGYSKIISENRSGLLYSREFSDEMNQKNVLLWVNDPIEMAPYELLYKGPRTEVKGVPGYVDKNILMPVMKGHHAIVLDTIKRNSSLYHLPGDTVRIFAENTYYEIDFKKDNGKTFTLFPRAQVNPNMGLIASPDIRIGLGQDLYTHVSSIPDPEQELEWSEVQEFDLEMDEQFFVEDFVAQLEGIVRVPEVQGVELGPQDVAIKAVVKIFGKSQEYIVEPIYLIKDKMVGRIPDYVMDLGFKFSFLHVHPEENNFTLGVETSQRDYVILKAMEKPLINLVWTGVIVMMIGFSMAIYRRIKEVK
jgi:cytochrome c-type biogenesis protein CcmF